ncbi:MAG: hypothetical protein O2897_04825 [bacterium]|nr:hypothetical protein [bacterium]
MHNFLTYSVFLSLCLTMLFSGCQCSKPAAHKHSTAHTSQKILDNFANAFTWQSEFDNDKSIFWIKVQLRDGFHAYAPGEEIGKPVGIEILDFNGWRMNGEAILPIGKTTSLGELGNSQVLENNFGVGAKVIGGKGNLQGIFKMQLCSNTSCDRPREYPFDFVIPDLKSN